ncbi:hypothetical protein EGM85_08705 [Macrococcus caseolyticus]|nr:hypothetical protein [Macrococcus caseolyticus]RKO13990.1 hypothetical protein D6861_08705 [Macrococcus caseolyticus]
MKNSNKALLIMTTSLALMILPFIVDILIIHFLDQTYSNLFILLVFLATSYLLSSTIELIIVTILKITLRMRKSEDFNILIKFFLSFLGSLLGFANSNILFTSVNINLSIIIAISIFHSIIFIIIEKINSIEI